MHGTLSLVHELLVVGSVDDVVRKVNQKLSQAPLCGCVVS